MSPSNRRDTTCNIRALLQPTRTRIVRMGMPAVHLTSTFALDQLTELARRYTAAQFVMLMAPIFGFDLPPRTYAQLQESLVAGTFKPPFHRVGHDAAQPADYDNGNRTVNIHAQAFDQLMQAPDRAWELLAILLHEFGHHVDNVLRQDLAPDSERDVDAPGEEGLRYAQAMAAGEATHEGAVCVARYTLADADEAEIVVDYHEAMQAIARFQGGTGITDAEGDREGFEAGSSDDHAGHFSHESIIEGLGHLGLNRDERQTIYFGNWLRDYSQLLDPKIVRAPWMPKNFPEVLSRHALTRIVDVLAARKFSTLRKRHSADFTVTEAKLGVYRPSEHIDNPRVVNPKPEDPKTRDPDFEPWVLPDAPLLHIDYDSSMKRYLQRSMEFMQQELSQAMRQGRTLSGLQRLGGALHVLEDLFAHSNFVELSLIKGGYKVLPWTSKADCKHGFPLVTGTFSGSDVISSLAYPVAKLIAPVEVQDLAPRASDDLSDNETMLLILLEEHHNPTWLRTYEAYLGARRRLSETAIIKDIQFIGKALSLPLQAIKNAYNEAFQGVFKWVGNSVDDAQTLLGDPNSNGSTDPSHSQLSKDHAEHPFHSLAAELASEAVTEVVKAMIDHWNRVPGADPVAVAGAYFAHPQDSQWQDEKIARWAAVHPDAIRRGASKSDLDRIHQRLQDVAHRELSGLKEKGLNTWQYFFTKVLGEVGLDTLLDKPPAPMKEGKLDTSKFGKFVVSNS